MSLICPGIINEPLNWVASPAKRPISVYWGTRDMRLRFLLKVFLKLNVRTDKAASPLCQSVLQCPGGCQSPSQPCNLIDHCRSHF
eukprot:scaffold4376_cov78-Cyclotella_meneghiniana.AAC.2